MPRFEVYRFNKHRGLFGYITPFGSLKESFDNETDARAYVSLMSKQDETVVLRIKKVEEGWLTY